VFLAELDIQPGENILLKIEEAKVSSRFMVLVMSPEWLTSDWTTLERAMAVYDDPAGLKGRIIPIMRRPCEPPPSIRILRWLDFTKDSRFESEFKKLAARIKGQTLRETLRHPQQLLGSLQPIQEATGADTQEEELASNIFPVLQLPSHVNVANARVKQRKDVWHLLGEGADLPTFAIDEDHHKVYSFADLKSAQYRFGEFCLEPSINVAPTATMVCGANSKILIEILNRAMTHHMQDIGMTYDWSNTKKTFFPLEKTEDETRLARWRVGKIEYTRFLVKKSQSTSPYYIHRSCKATFTTISDWPYLKIQPGWHFTKDGLENPVTPSLMTSLSARWMNKQRNHSVLDEVRFWAYILAKGSTKIELKVGGINTSLIATTPVFANVNCGIEGDYRKRLWLEKPSPDFVDSPANARNP
jgi:hypothetical protein